LHEYLHEHSAASVLPPGTFPVVSAPTVPDEQLIAALGPDFLAYVAACEPDVFEADSAETLKERQREVVAKALLFARRFSAWRRPNASNDDEVPREGDEWEPFVSSFGQFAELHDGQTLADRLRAAAGGDVELPEPTDDMLADGLLRFAHDLWPVVLIARYDTAPPFLRRPTGIAAAAAFRHPAHDQIRAALSEVREPLRQWFPDLDTEIPTTVPLELSSGVGGSAQLPLFAEHLLDGAAWRSGWPERVDRDAYLAAIELELAELRLLARGRSAEVPASVGLAGLTLEPDTRLETALGTLEPWRRRRPTLPGERDPDVELQLTFPLKVSRQPPEGMTGVPAGYVESWREFHRRVDLFRLAVVLAQAEGQPRVLRVVTEQVQDPVLSTGVSGHFVAPVLSSPFEVEHTQELVRWATILKERFDQQLAMAVRRAVSAADPMRDPEDALVDAVIALESLFGTREGEVGFRLAAALAFLFGNTEEERTALHKEVSELYKVRSKIVHGGHVPDELELQQLRQRALALALDALRSLFTTHAHLIPDEARGKRLILGAGVLPVVEGDEPDG
jgi:hypothetical protein